jgi:hypothetical protein
MRTLIVAAIAGLGLVIPFGASAQRPVLELTGAASYTQVYRFDYSKDGHRNPVRFFIEFKARPAVGTDGQPGYVPESGSIHYYVFDIEKNQRVEKWLEGFAMLNHDAVAAEHPATNIVITGNTATFEAFRMKWKVVDGGPGFEEDSVTVDDGFRAKPLKLYAGDLTIAPAK